MDPLLDTAAESLRREAMGTRPRRAAL